MPGNPQNVNVTAINSTTIHVEWEPPGANEQNGVIRGYHVHVQEVREEVRMLIINHNIDNRALGYKICLETKLLCIRGTIVHFQWRLSARKL